MEWPAIGYSTDHTLFMIALGLTLLWLKTQIQTSTGNTVSAIILKQACNYHESMIPILNHNHINY